jgi:diguanylate cyclase (GGDEF)-like protein/PAS domain S-box-containing protein
MRSELTIKEILHTGILSCPPDTPLSSAARSMANAHCSSIVVMEGGKALGIWTEQDAVGLDLSDPAQYQAPISGFMSAPVITIPIDATLGEAAQRFREEGIRHFTVTDTAGAVRGVVSQSDIVLNQGIEYFVSLRELDSVFTRQYTSVPASMAVADAVREMHGKHLDALIVEGANGELGILTERDVLRMISSGHTAATIKEIASFPLLTLPVTATLYHARKLFINKRIRHLGVTGESGKLVGLVTFSGILENIEHEYVRHLREALRESEASLAHSNQRLRSAAKVFESTFEGIVVTNADRIVESVNPAFTRITGYHAEDIVGKTPALLASGRHDEAFYRTMYDSLENTGHWQGEICNRHKSGRIYVEWISINAIFDDSGRLTNYVAVFSDFTARKAVEEQMRYMAQHDGLTGLPNRTLLLQRITRAISHSKRNGKKLAILFLDLNDFKDINDQHGHEAGDHVLKVIAQRLAKGAREEDTVARLGGDEFVVLLEEVLSIEPLPAIADKLMQSIAAPIPYEHIELRISASAGISIYPDDATEPADLVRNADLAMYKSKDLGGNAVRFFGSTDD